MQPRFPDILHTNAIELFCSPRVFALLHSDAECAGGGVQEALCGMQWSFDPRALDTPASPHVGGMTDNYGTFYFADCHFDTL